MAIGQTGSVAVAIQTLWNSGACTGLTDGQLLDRFANASPEEASVAFEALVQRHGPMVLHVCRVVLTDPNDADDAFQATFLALVRSGASIRDRNSLASWLFGTARRVALRVRSDAARRREVERRGARVSDQDAVDPGPRCVDPAVLEEVDRLPIIYRAPIVLCYLEGSSHDGAAQQLGWPVGTVRGRLARREELLKTRLTRRGLSVPSTLIGAGVIASEARAVVPPVLIRSATQAARAIAAGRAADVSARVAAWTEHGLRSAAFVRWKLAAGLVALLTAAGVGLVAASSATAPPSQAQPQPKVTPPLARDDQVTIQGTWSKMDETTYYVGGVAQPPKRYKYSWSITTDTITTSDDEGHASEVYRYTLDPDASPKTIEMNSMNLGFTLHGIYKLDGDALTVCFGHERPKEFKETPWHVLVNLPRESRTPVQVGPRIPKCPGMLLGLGTERRFAFVDG